MRDWLYNSLHCYSIPFFPSQDSSEHHLGFREKSWNKYIKRFMYREKFQISLEISLEFLFGNWQYVSNLRALPTASLFVCWSANVSIGRGSSV
jgi:hypothetical protein